MVKQLDTPAQPASITTGITDVQLLSLASAHRWLQGYFEGAGLQMPYHVRRAIWDFMPYHLRFAEEHPDHIKETSE